MKYMPISVEFSFQSTLPMRGATMIGNVLAMVYEVSIHASHAGSDAGPGDLVRALIAFQSTLPTRGATDTSLPMR